MNFAQTVEDDESNFQRSPDRIPEPHSEAFDIDEATLQAAKQIAANKGVSVSLAAKIYFNTAENVTQQLKALDLCLKSEILFFELSSVVYWTSQLELIVFYFATVVWISQVSALAIIWLHIVHIPRAICGIMLVVRMPNTHDLISDVDLPPKDKI